MASASTPSSKSSSLPPKPTTTNSHNSHNHSRNQQQRRNNNHRWSSNRNSAGPSATSGTAPSAFSSSFLGARKSWLAPDFSSRRSTRFAAKMHSGRPRTSQNKHPHSKAAEEALHWLLEAGNNPVTVDNVLDNYDFAI